MKDIQFIHVVLGSAKPLLVLRCSCDERATLILRILLFVIGQKVLEKFYFLETSAEFKKFDTYFLAKPCILLVHCHRPLLKPLTI
jgi:hypothetical protein